MIHIAKEKTQNFAAKEPEADKGFEWLDREVEYNDGGLAEIVTDNLFDKIHSDPCWLPFHRKIDKSPDQLAKIEFHVTLTNDAASSK